MSFAITERCSGCTRCVVHCPTGAIAGAPNGPHRIASERCIDCGACGVVCGDGAVLDERGEVFGLGLDGLRAARAGAWADPARCTGCGDCVAACPFDALELVRAAPSSSLARALAVVLDARCVGCSLCELECVRGAISVRRGGSPGPRPVRGL